MNFFNTILDQEYRIFVVYSNGVTDQFDNTLRILMQDYNSENPEEVTICIQEALPEIMQMHVTDSKHFKPCRDDSTSKGIIVRLK